MNNFLEVLKQTIETSSDISVFAGASDGYKYIGAGISMVAGLGAALGQGYIGGKAIEALARNPEVEALIFRQYIVGAAICESVAIYGLIISILMMFAI